MIILGVIITFVFVIITSAIPITMIVIGSKNLDNCPIENKIPIYLIVQGSVDLCFTVNSLVILLAKLISKKGEG